ncbi:MAG: DNA translocase FtsK 4TM domain-containing protein [Firmicutes bacterium]|nr:DNA translocase FtsK 4TM domain-containing protein [Bacillota bacterium]
MANIPKSKKKSEDKMNYYICAGVGVFLALVVYFDGFLGFVGGFFSGILLGLIGVAGYFIPVALIIIAVVNIFFDTEIINKLLIVKFSALIAVFVAFTHIFAVQNQENVDFWQNLQFLYSQGGIGNGGLIGGLIGNFLRGILGEGFAIAVLVIAAIAVLVLISLPIILKFWSNFANNADDLFDDDESDGGDDDGYDFEEELEDFEDANDKPRTSRFPPPVQVVRSKTTKKPFENVHPKQPIRQSSQTSKRAEYTQPRSDIFFDILENEKPKEGKVAWLQEDLTISKAKPVNKAEKSKKITQLAELEELDEILPIEDLEITKGRLQKILDKPIEPINEEEN